MPEPRRERADAARNRAAILAAAEELLVANGPDHVSLERVAQAAGVGKATVFHRFGSRSGLMRALMEDRVRKLTETIETGPPPLGPGAPATDRLLAFLDAVVDLATRNAALVAAYEKAAGEERQAGDVYQYWHRHVSGLIAQARSGLDAELLAHILLGALHSDLVVHLVRRGDTDRLRTTLHELVGSLLAPKAR
ncbi:TetR/AcrR family transcriptional regulator [Amycolatopsis sp. MtRt-6]|uniref:TetR/AcrR family transcriptional regulator n=1 Tax=Amycolatopsis sp. MtRt-6 TaxID=2792782 RepID=UPI001A90C2D8|nr:TetR/AcrR family transcriptional regulator [Amycolatopsis sp. MtRt-6]